MATATKPIDQPTAGKSGARKPKPLPPPNSDFYELVETLPAEEVAVGGEETTAGLKGGQ